MKTAMVPARTLADVVKVALQESRRLTEDQRAACVATAIREYCAGEFNLALIELSYKENSSNSIVILYKLWRTLFPSETIERSSHEEKTQKT